MRKTSAESRSGTAGFSRFRTTGRRDNGRRPGSNSTMNGFTPRQRQSAKIVKTPRRGRRLRKNASATVRVRRERSPLFPALNETGPLRVMTIWKAVRIPIAKRGANAGSGAWSRISKAWDDMNRSCFASQPAAGDSAGPATAMLRFACTILRASWLAKKLKSTAATAGRSSSAKGRASLQSSSTPKSGGCWSSKIEGAGWPAVPSSARDSILPTSFAARRRRSSAFQLCIGATDRFVTRRAVGRGPQVVEKSGDLQQPAEPGQHGQMRPGVPAQDQKEDIGQAAFRRSKGNARQSPSVSDDRCAQGVRQRIARVRNGDAGFETRGHGLFAFEYRRQEQGRLPDLPGAAGDFQHQFESGMPGPRCERHLNRLGTQQAGQRRQAL